MTLDQRGDEVGHRVAGLLGNAEQGTPRTQACSVTSFTDEAFIELSESVQYQLVAHVRFVSSSVVFMYRAFIRVKRDHQRLPQPWSCIKAPIAE